MPLPLSPPLCDNCGKEILTRRDKYCRACFREGLPGLRHIGESTKRLLIAAAKNALVYWTRQEDMWNILADPSAAAHAADQVAFFKKQLQDLTDGKP